MRSLAVIVLLLPAIAFGQSVWTTPRLLNPSLQTQTTPYVTVGPNNQFVIVCSDPGHIGVYRTTNGGKDFIHTDVPWPNATDFNLEPRGTGYDGQGNLFVLWKWAENSFPFRETLVLSKSTDGGSTFATFWQHGQRLFFLRENPLFIDPNNTVHLIWDSITTNANFVLFYAKFVNGNPGNIVSHVVPRLDTLQEGIPSASMLISGATIHFVIQSSTSSVSPSYYTRSTNGGISFSPYILIDSLSRMPRLVRTTQGNAVFYGRHQSVGSSGIPILRFVPDSSLNISDPLLLRTKTISLDAAKGVITYGGKNYLTYTGVAGNTAVSCYYGFGDLSGQPSDSAFFPSFFETNFAIDSLGGKYLVATQIPAYKMYVMTKDIVSSVEEMHNSQSALGNSVSISVGQGSATATISLHLRNAVEGSLVVYEILGREVLVVHTGIFNAGNHQFAIKTGSISSGTYFTVLQSRSETITSKFVLLR
jgi:hypothetical protein